MKVFSSSLDPVAVESGEMGQDVEGMGLAERAICLSLFVCLAVAVFTTVGDRRKHPRLTCPPSGGTDLPHQHSLHSHPEGTQCGVREDPGDVHQYPVREHHLLQECLVFRVVHGWPWWEPPASWMKVTIALSIFLICRKGLCTSLCRGPSKWNRCHFLWLSQCELTCLSVHSVTVSVADFQQDLPHYQWPSKQPDMEV